MVSRRSIKIKKKSFYILILLMPYFMPDAFLQIAWIKQLNPVCKVLSLMVGMVLFFRKNSLKKILESKMVLFCYLYYLELLIVTLIHGYSLIHVLMNISQFFLLCLMLDDYTEGANVLTDLLIFEVILNFATILLFRNGLYTNDDGYTRNWLLGYKNTPIRLMLPMLTLYTFTHLRHYSKVKRLILWLVILLSQMMMGTSTGLVGALIYEIVWLILVCVPNRPISISKIFIIYSVFDFIFVIMNNLTVITNIFGSFIMHFLHRGLSFTGRNEIWVRAWKLIRQNLMLGIGDYDVEIISPMILGSHPHNYLMYVLLQGGIVGLVLVFFIFYYMDKEISYKLRKDEYASEVAMYSAFFGMGLAESLTGSQLFYLMPVLMFCLTKKTSVRNGRNCIDDIFAVEDL